MKSGLYLLQNLLFIPGIFHIEPLITVCWSLSFEWAFYLTIPLLIAVLRMRKWPPKQRVFALAAMWVLAGLWCALFARGMRLRMATFLCGAALYELQSMGSLVHVARRSWELAAVATTALGTYMLYIAEKNSGHRMAFDYVMPIMALGVAFFVLCAAVIGYNGSANRLFLWRPLRYLGNMSFSYFLLHGLTLKAVSILAHAIHLEYTWKNFVFLMLFGFACTWITSTVLFVLIEKRFSLASGQRVAASSVLSTGRDVQPKQENISSVSI
jgi:peptidoglycan/LPS O-acetylase OafA/YrhL